MDRDYVQHMLQKYRLAVALAVIRNKPHNISVESYIAELRMNIRNSESNDTLSNMSVEEEDFNLSDDGLQNAPIDLNENQNSNDSATILQNYDFNSLVGNGNQSSLPDVAHILDNYEGDQDVEVTIAKEASSQNLTLSINFESQKYNEINDLNNISTATDLQYSDLHSDGIKAKVQSNLQKDKQLNEDKNDIKNDRPQSTQAIITDLNIYDSQETETYNGLTPYNTHISQSQDDVVISKNYLSNKERSANNKCYDDNTINNDGNTEIKMTNNSDAKLKVFNYMNKELEAELNKNAYQDSEVPVHVRKKLQPIQYTDSMDTGLCVNNNQTTGVEIKFNVSENVEEDHIKKNTNKTFNRYDTARILNSQLFTLSQESSNKTDRLKYDNIQHSSQVLNDMKYRDENNISLDFGFLNTYNSDISKINNSNVQNHTFSDFELTRSQCAMTSGKQSLNLNNSKISSQNNRDYRSLFIVNANTLNAIDRYCQSMGSIYRNQNMTNTFGRFNGARCASFEINNEGTSKSHDNGKIINTNHNNNRVITDLNGIDLININESINRSMKNIYTDQNMTTTFEPYNDTNFEINNDTSKSNIDNKVINTSNKNGTLIFTDTKSINELKHNNLIHLMDSKYSLNRSMENVFGDQNMTNTFGQHNIDYGTNTNEGKTINSYVQDKTNNTFLNDDRKITNKINSDVELRCGDGIDLIHSKGIKRKASDLIFPSESSQKVAGYQIPDPGITKKADKNTRPFKIIKEHPVPPLNESIQSNVGNDLANERINVTNERIYCPESDSDGALQDLTDSQASAVPFKVIEELNKIKMYLNKRKRNTDSRGPDSGYISNPRETYHASQYDLWLNQSSHCLFSYLSQCPLLVSTMEINYEIAKVLGLLIDRLHEDEKYPTFLEEMLEFIENTLMSVYQGSSEDDNVFLKNDESIDRLLLLNKSQNIIKFTIEKITNILEVFYERLQNGGHIELENINAAENLSFVFHLLEVLLKKHSTNLSQNSHQSQEKILKRSTLTEIWRKKWNLTKAEVFQREERRDVIAICSDVLNKIIVKSMDGYSLVAFAALQCFNLLQS